MKENKNILRDIILKFWENETFKNQLISDPISTIEKEFDVVIELPKGKSMVVNDQTDEGVVYLNIPPEPAISNIELSENDLELIAGGVNISLHHVINIVKHKELQNIIK